MNTARSQVQNRTEPYELIRGFVEKIVFWLFPGLFPEQKILDRYKRESVALLVVISETYQEGETYLRALQECTRQLTELREKCILDSEKITGQKIIIATLRENIAQCHARK